jgi:hypothetical protein
MIDTTEIVQTIDHLQRTFEDLMLRGLKAAGPGEINTLTNIREECERIGAYYLAGQVGAIVDAIQTNSRSAASALMRAQTTLRLFDRILTLENARIILANGISEDIEDDDDIGDDGSLAEDEVAN